ncbi:MAG: EVE domain-containing protein [Ignavibacteria bacterium]
MAYYLFKTEPTVYSYSDLERDKKAVWDGVTSPGGLFQIKTARKGDVAFIYHTGKEKQVVGICEITTDPYVDPKAGNPKIFIFDIKPRRRLPNPVTLEEIKKDKRTFDSRIVTEGRLSVQPVPEKVWNAILEISGLEASTVFSKNGK